MLNSDYSSSLSEADLVKIIYSSVAPQDIQSHLTRLNATDTNSLDFGVHLGKTIGASVNDLFCGAGGLSIGFEEAGFQLNYASDLNKTAIETFNLNRSKIAHGTVEDLSSKGALNNIPKADITIGGPPCQGFSTANRQQKPFDERNKLYLNFLDAASVADSKFVVIENVIGILKIEEEVNEALKHHGFQARPFSLQASDFGAPQNRKRVFWIGIKTQNSTESERFFKCFERGIGKIKKCATPRSLKSVIQGLPALKAKTKANSTALENSAFGYSMNHRKLKFSDYEKFITPGPGISYQFNHRSKFNNDRDIAIYKALPEGGDSSHPSITHLNPYRNRDSIFKDKFFRLFSNQVCKTITAHMYYDCHMYIHPMQARGLSPREAARVQGFPETYVFSGKPNEWYRQIGNAVSPILSRAVAKVISEII